MFFALCEQKRENLAGPNSGLKGLSLISAGICELELEDLCLIKRNVLKQIQELSASEAESLLSSDLRSAPSTAKKPFFFKVT